MVRATVSEVLLVRRKSEAPTDNTVGFHDGSEISLWIWQLESSNRIEQSSSGLIIDSIAVLGIIVHVTFWMNGFRVAQVEFGEVRIHILGSLLVGRLFCMVTQG